MLTQEQQLFRRSGLGGSDIAAVCGLSPFRKPIDVYLDKVAEGEPDELPPTNAQRFGSVLEPVVADEYARRHEVEVLGPFSSMRVEGRPWHLYTLDRIVLTSKPEGITTIAAAGRELPPRDAIDRVLEIKTAGIGTARTYGADGTDDLPEHIVCQVAWYLAAVEVEQATVAALINTSDYREFHVQRDRELEGYLLDEGEKFWQRIARREPPEPDGSESFGQYLRQRFDRNVGNILPANPEVDEFAADLAAMRRHAKQTAQGIELLEQRIKLAIGDADGIETSSGRISWKCDRVGRVSYRDLAVELMSELPEPVRDELLASHRGTAPRRFITPRKWLQTETNKD